MFENSMLNGNCTELQQSDHCATCSALIFRCSDAENECVNGVRVDLYTPGEHAPSAFDGVRGQRMKASGEAGGEGRPIGRIDRRMEGRGDASSIDDSLKFTDSFFLLKKQTQRTNCTIFHNLCYSVQNRTVLQDTSRVIWTIKLSLSSIGL